MSFFDALRWLKMTTAGAALLALTALNPHSPVFVDPAQPVAVESGEEFFIALASNPTTGFLWQQSTSDGKTTVTYEGNVYQPPANPIPGAGGQQIFIYHANRHGATTITLTYSRPFETNVPPAKTVAFNVAVQ